MRDLPLASPWSACRRPRPPVLVLQALVREGIEVALPVLTEVRYPAERTWEEDGS